jgi:hypothetical protein
MWREQGKAANQRAAVNKCKEAVHNREDVKL